MPPFEVGQPSDNPGQTVEITAEDGVLLQGELYVITDVLAPGVLLLADDGASWGDFPDKLYAAGYTVLVMPVRPANALSDFHVMLQTLINGVADPARLGVVGAGNGANVALLGCADDDLCDAVALLSPLPDPALLDAAHARAGEAEATDDAALAEGLCPVAVVPGEEGNVKITTPADLDLLRAETRLWPCVGYGYDVHRYGEGRPMVLGGVPIPGAPQVVAHSDGDVLLHALADAVLGCFGGGDIGLHFPDTDPRWSGANSAVLLQETLAMAQAAGLSLEQADLTIVAQIPKIAPHREAIAANVAHLLGLERSRVNVKATTEEGLGFTGEKKGIKAVAVVTATRSAA
jgi:2-C-methyl-D-erythritol 2,4-cyclodiphosphate synthase